MSYGNWTLATGSAKDWDQFVIPQLDGFTSYVDGSAAKKEIAKEDVTVEVTYKNSGNHGDNTKPDNVPNPSDHNNPNFENNNHGNNHPNKRNNDSNSVSNDIDQNGNRSLNTNPTVKSNRSNGVSAKITYNDHGENGQKNKRALPQTGNNKDDAAIAGLGLASLLAMLGLGDLKKRRN
ncbi:LPXTG cell wall anchor domain-containing protein [Limosilactobacillus portuensis]|uniref:LPXTG cell wall anchor domain-containing protein n=1 Tax=Limosilactobacillus portuensis TaxID=2742601 RepID=UPI002E2B0F0B|nr:LPXTG cell wall anchor domain-containing protein [Limosilactobacillus portuensis]